jgi:DNA-binding transcriptional regulator YiaG
MRPADRAHLADRIDPGPEPTAEDYRAARALTGLTQEQLSAALGVSVAAVRDHEQGRHPAGAETRRKLAELVRGA